jgi:hypothetical protein
VSPGGGKGQARLLDWSCARLDDRALPLRLPAGTAACAAGASLTGAAMVLSPAGEVALCSGSVQDIDAGQVARIAVRALRAAKDDLVSFSYEGCCVHAAPLGLGWTLCVMSNATRSR